VQFFEVFVVEVPVDVSVPVEELYSYKVAFVVMESAILVTAPSAVTVTFVDDVLVAATTTAGIPIGLTISDVSFAELANVTPLTENIREKIVIVKTRILIDFFIGILLKSLFNILGGFFDQNVALKQNIFCK
jgi:hypothetical protein